MFFNSSDISVNILSVIDLEWDRVNATASKRPFHALAFRLIGGATLKSAGHDDLTVYEDELVFTPAEYDFHKSAEKGRIIAIHFFSDSGLPDTIQSFAPKNPDFFRQEFIKLYNVWSKKLLGYQHEAKMIFYRIIFEIEREWAEKTPSLANAHLSPALARIHESFTDSNISVDGLSRLCGMSDTYFRRLFVAEFGITPLRYINRLRMDLARELLRSSYYTVEEISERCGFNNINYFCLFIKKETGMSPLNYRKKLLSSLSDNIDKK